MNLDIYSDESRLELLVSKRRWLHGYDGVNGSLCFAMQVTEAKKPFVGLKHLAEVSL